MIFNHCRLKKNNVPNVVMKKRIHGRDRPEVVMNLLLDSTVVLNVNIRGESILNNLQTQILSE